MRPIDADAAKKDFGEHFGDVHDAVCAQHIIDRQPTIDLRDLQPHGWWEHLGGDEWFCTHCEHVISTEGRWESPESKYCPNCGAKMDEEVPNG